MWRPRRRLSWLRPQLHLHPHPPPQSADPPLLPSLKGRYRLATSLCFESEKERYSADAASSANLGGEHDDVAEGSLCD